MESTVYALLALVLLRSLIPAASQDCSLPDGDAINIRLRSLLTSIGGEGATLVTTLLDHHFTCLAVGSSRDQYRQVSVAVRYTKNTESGNFTAQFTLRCTSGNFGTVGELDQSPPANVFDISTRRDCFICTTQDTHSMFTIDAVADCALCGSSCLNVGQGGCVTSSSNCCPFYTGTDGSCTTSCGTNYNADSSSNYTCVCSGGFTGMNCETNIDDCGTKPCVNGTCTDLVNGYSCTCQAGFTGTNCDMDIDDCATNPCVNGACADLVNGYSCTCQAGYTGINCDTNIDDCATNPCVNGACADLVNGYSCTCQAGYTGTNCDTNIDDCATNPCVNGACADLVNGYNCTCQAGYSGTNCNIDIDECATNPCVNGTCADVVNGYSCTCQAGYTGTNCDLPSAPSNDPCTPNPCQNGGRCSTSDGSSRAECACINSWRGSDCIQCAVPNCAQCSQSREGCGTCDHGYTLQDNTGQCVASVPTPSFPPRGDGILPWHWIVIAVSIVAAIFLTFATFIGFITWCACRKPNKAATTEKEMGMDNISTDATKVLKNDSL